MSIYHITYMSDTYRVKGYLAIPDSISITHNELQHHFQGYYPKAPDLPIVELEGGIEARHTSPQLPALIYCRGGIGKVGMVKLEWVRLFASLGFVVFAPSYRGNEGGEGRDEFGGADQEDVNAGFRLLQSFSFVNPQRINLLGFSRGSINAWQTASSFPDTHKLILWGGVTDLAKTYEQRIDLRRMLKRVIGGTPAKYPERYSKRSPLMNLKAIHCPVLVVHGTDDVQVDVSHGIELFHALTSIGHPVESHFYSGYGHHLPPPVHEAVVERMLDWVRNDEPCYDKKEKE